MRGKAEQCSGKRELEGAILRPEGTTFRGRQGKKPKNLAGARQNDPPPLEKKVVSETGLSSPNRYIGISGIAEAAIAKKAMKRAQKIEMYSDAVALGYMKAESMEVPEGM
jgi:hypothetical protein